MTDAPPRDLLHDVEAIGWSVAMGLVPDYGHDNAAALVEAGRARLIVAWNDAMEDTLARTGLTISTVMTNATVLYPAINGCPPGGESVVVLSGSSNPTRVPADRFDDFVAAVERTVEIARADMRQNSVRIEFTTIRRSTYFRADGRY